MTALDPTPHLKRITRAEQVGRQLASSIQTWVTSEPARGEVQIADDRLSLSVILRLQQTPPLEEWCWSFGESVHHLRATLDNLVMSIAGAAAVPASKAKRVSFPVSATQQAWSKDRLKIKDLPIEYRTAIEAIQPFQRGDDQAARNDPLVLLRDLDNQDKHYIQVAGSLEPSELRHEGALVFESEAGARASLPPEVEVFATPFEDGQTLMHWRTKGRVADVKGSFNIVGQVQVALPGGRQEGVTQLLAALCVYTRQVVDYVTSA
ncbi:hypothetical protein [Actinomadura violacea]|uniref:Uncharacterized protein n=1 Tax=Actinomadura violacea TaxID=2819934 RepID=A0ABS3S8A5_9ACTN|nr:hypothetical protein [Actinomadura violacea]MBO2465223.1 hypothetical protein [Actinomadura violacea]